MEGKITHCNGCTYATIVPGAARQFWLNQTTFYRTSGFTWRSTKKIKTQIADPESRDFARQEQCLKQTSAKDELSEISKLPSLEQDSKVSMGSLEIEDPEFGFEKYIKCF